jgi:hypothetical protein
VTGTGEDLSGTLGGVDQTVNDTVGALPDLP